MRGIDDTVSKEKSFLEEVLEVYKTMLGDQLALAWIFFKQPLFDAQYFKNPKLLLLKFTEDTDPLVTMCHL